MIAVTTKQDDKTAGSRDRRAVPRHRTLKAGKVVFHDGCSVLDCTVRNVSDVGALVMVQNAVSVPETFELRWDDTVHLCTVTWRRLDRLGVRFR
jgi:hypothetical protein